MGTRRSLSRSGGKLRLVSAGLMLAMATTATMACSQAVRGNAHLPGGGNGWDGSPNVKNIGVSTDPSATQNSKSRSPSSSPYPTDTTDPASTHSSGGDLNAYVNGQGLTHEPVDAGGGLTVTTKAPPGWAPQGSKDPGAQVAIQRSSPRAVMLVDVARFTGSFDVSALLAAARVSIAADGDIKVKDDTDYQNHPSTAGVVLTASKDGTQLAEILRYVVVQGVSSSEFYLVSSAIAVAASDWNSLKEELVRLDSNMNISS